MAQMRNVIIIGAGPAGISAATYLKRAGLDPLVFECGKPGGLMRNANLVENYPGFSKGIKGEELADRFAEHLGRLRIETRKQKVTRLDYARGRFLASTESGAYYSKAVIVASGTVPKTPDIPGVSKLLGKKVFSELVSIPPAKPTGAGALVAGGGDAAFDYALSLDERGYEVTVLTRSDPRCLPLLLERALRRGIVTRVGVEVEGVEDARNGIKLRCRHGKKPLILTASLLLTAFGRSPNLKFVEPKLLKRIGIPGNAPETRVPGLYLAGDVIRGHNRQAGIAVGDGILAAMLAEGRVRGGRA